MLPSEDDSVAFVELLFEVLFDTFVLFDEELLVWLVGGGICTHNDSFLV